MIHLGACWEPQNVPLRGWGTLLHCDFLAITIHLGNNNTGIIYLTLISGSAIFYFLNMFLFYSWKLLSRLPSKVCYLFCTSLEHVVTDVWRSLRKIDVFPTEWLQSYCISDIKYFQHLFKQGKNHLDYQNVLDFKFLHWCLGKSIRMQ